MIMLSALIEMELINNNYVKHIKIWIYVNELKNY